VDRKGYKKRTMFAIKSAVPRVSILRSIRRTEVSNFVHFQARSYASEQKKEKTINLKGFITVGIFASIILTQVVDAVQKEKPLPRSMSEAEYYRQQQRLKRKVSLFTDEQKQVYFLKGVALPDIQLDGVTVIDPKKLVADEKKDESSKYHALLNDTDQIPRGLIVDLISKYLGSQPDGKFLVLNYPSDIKESTQFEDKVVTIKKLIALKQDAVDDVVKYYKTVDKVGEIDSLDELKQIVQ
jgi:hypothetical protein